MPELPEVETIKNDLKERMLGKKIKTVEVKDKKIVKGNLANFLNMLKGSYFKEISRKGKLMILKIGRRDEFMLVHLKMTGQLVFAKAPLIKGGKGGIVAGGHYTPDFNQLPNKHTRVIFEFVDGSHLYFNDMRRFGYLEIVGKEKLEKIKNKFGIEPLTSNFKFNEFSEIFKKREASVKGLLLNQNLIAGIGNIYADEILFYAGIRPDRKGKSLSRKELKNIFDSTKVILKRAIKYRGTTFSSYVDTSGKKGGFVKFLRVYGRKEGEKCFRCPGVIKKTRVAGRGTRYCGKCQK